MVSDHEKKGLIMKRERRFQIARVSDRIVMVHNARESSSSQRRMEGKGERERERALVPNAGIRRLESHLVDMAEAAPAVPSNELLEWPKKDKRRFLHVVYRVGDLDRTIKYAYRRETFQEEKYSNAFLGFGPEESNFVVELTYNYGVDKYDIGTGFGHFAIATPDVSNHNTVKYFGTLFECGDMVSSSHVQVYKLVEDIKAKGGIITREPGPVKGGKTVIAFAKDPDGYLFELIQRGPTPEPLCQVMLRVGDLDRSIKFYEKALGMKLLKKTDRPEQKYTIAMMGYADEYETTVLELTYNYGVTEYTKGNAYGQVAISTDDVYKSAEVVNLVTQELGGQITRQPGPIPGLNTKITAFLDPDGWKTVLVDNEDFLKELEKFWCYAEFVRFGDTEHDIVKKRGRVW
ncbi:hypothetical protein HYC85_019026 [Camellia sinensis]|uniref:lactoylglutathione lyase n=1 Tax=Camellia sinensis TaxID=4442 RepID=A0A7J7GW10_CAMSI|nr:hypothetical protein HYC85_019026 [Camellia sinensis]